MLNDGKVLIADGWDANGSALAPAEIFAPGAGTFASTGSMEVGEKKN